ncbi:MAG: hypothetical protein WBL70_10120 [Candidatus Acidiferrales bacterium]
MNKITRSLLGFCLVLSCSCIVSAQEKKPMENHSIPRVMQITREFVKPGKTGFEHDATESAFVQAERRANWPTHYLGMTSLSGKSRALFLTQYASFDAWEKDYAAQAKNPEFAAALDRAGVADGELLEDIDAGVFVFSDEMSLRPHADLSDFRYMEISAYHVREGHDAEWSEIVKMVKAAYEKSIPDAHWGMFEEMYGGENGTYIVLTGRKNLAEIDRGFMDSKKFEEALGPDGMKKLDELAASAIESSTHNLFAIDPQMSYVDESWIKAYPDFWKP